MSQLADANAYTDFRSTVYTLSAPTRGVDYRGSRQPSGSSAQRYYLHAIMECLSFVLFIFGMKLSSQVYARWALICA